MIPKPKKIKWKFEVIWVLGAFIKLSALGIWCLIKILVPIVGVGYIGYILIKYFI